MEALIVPVLSMSASSPSGTPRGLESGFFLKKENMSVGPVGPPQYSQLCSAVEL